MIKTTTIFFYGEDSGPAVIAVQTERSRRDNAFSRDATAFSGEIEPCDRVVIFPDVHDSVRGRIAEAYAGHARVDVIETVPQTMPTAPEPPRPSLEPVVPPAEYAVGKGPKGRLYARRAGKIVSPGFDTEAEVVAFMNLPQKEA